MTFELNSTAMWFLIVGFIIGVLVGKCFLHKMCRMGPWHRPAPVEMKYDGKPCECKHHHECRCPAHRK